METIDNTFPATSNSDKPKNKALKIIIIVLGYFLLSLIIIGALFKIQHWPGAGVMLTLGLSSFSILFLPVFFLLRILEGKGVLNVFVNIFGFLSLSGIFLGVLFKIQHWPGGGVMLVLGAQSLIFPTLLLYIIQQVKNEGRSFSEYWRMVFCALVVAVFFMVYGSNYSRNILHGFLHVEDGMLETNENLKIVNARFNARILAQSPGAAKQASAVAQSSQDMYNYIEQVKAMVIQKTDYSDEGIHNHWNINSLDNYDIPMHLLGMSHSELGKELGEMLQRYNEELRTAINSLPPESKEKITEEYKGVELSFNPQMRFDENAGWNEIMFYNAPLSATLALLTGLQNKVLNAELNALIIIDNSSR